MGIILKLGSRKTSRHRRYLENTLKKIVVSGNLLDIGGAQKPIIDRISQKSNVKKCQILDLPNPHSLNFTGIDYRIDIQSRDFNASALELKYDAIFCIEVSLYWHDPFQAIQNIVSIMSPETKLFINFHQLHANQKPESSDMLRYSFNWIEKVCQIYKLQIITVKKSEISNLSYLALKMLYAVEKMRLNTNYNYFKTNSFFVELKLAND